MYELNISCLNFVNTIKISIEDIKLFIKKKTLETNVKIPFDLHKA